MSAETMKMPEPIMVPTTSEMAASGPMPSDELLGTRSVAGSAVAVMVSLVVRW